MSKDEFEKARDAAAFSEAKINKLVHYEAFQGWVLGANWAYNWCQKNRISKTALAWDQSEKLKIAVEALEFYNSRALFEHGYEMNFPEVAKQALDKIKNEGRS